MANTYPALQVSFAPGVASSAVPTALQWVDITSYVASLDGKYGTEDEFSEPSAGSLAIELDNHTGRFDPDNSSGPYYGQLLPLVWFRVKGGTTAANTDVFYGQVSIEGWRLAASQFPDSAVSVTVVDMFEQLANTDLPGSVYEIEVGADAPDVWWRLGESSGTVAVDSSSNNRPGAYENGATFGSRTGLIANEADNAIMLNGTTYVWRRENPVTGTGDFSVEFWISHSYDQSAEFQPRPIAYAGNDALGYWKIWSRSGDSGLGFLTGSGAGVSAVASYTTGLNDGDPHHVVCRRTAGTLTIAVDGSVVATTGGSTDSIAAGPIFVGVGDPLALLGGLPDAVYDEFAVYGSSLSTARIAAHYTAGSEPWGSESTSARITHLLDAIAFPASLRTIGTGDTTMPAADLNTGTLPALQAAAKAERGDLYVDHHDGGKLRFRGRHAKWTEARSVTSQATFGDSGAEVTYSAIDIQDDRIVNYASEQRAGGATIVVRDSASETQYQRRTLSETGLLVETDAEMQARGELIVAEKKDRHRRVRSITLEPTKSTHSAWAQVFARELGDRVTVKWRPAYGGTYSYDSWIIGVAFLWRPRDSKPWRTVFYLAPVPYGATGAPYFIVGTSTVDGPARIGY